MTKKEALLNSARLIHIKKNTGTAKINSYNKDFTLIPFYSYGFFDELIYIKSKDNNYLSYKNCLGIDYPNKKTNVLTEQIFCIYDGKTNGKSDEVFEYSADDKPFLGVILVSINRIDVDFDKLTNSSISKLLELFNKADFLVEIYKTLNCADLCITIRTDNIRKIYDSASLIKNYFDKNRVQSNITTIQCVSFETSWITGNSYIYDINKDIEFDLRTTSTKSYDSFECLGVLGMGGKVLRVNFEEYFKKIFCDFIKNKFSDGVSNTEIVHERIFYKNISNNMHERFTFKKVDYNKKIKYINSLRSELANIENELQELSLNNYLFISELILMEELINTFCDLWFQYTSVNGYIFYVQCSLLFDGIKKYITIIKSSSHKSEAILCEMLKTNIKKTIDCINNYNKMLQFLNQDSVNFPTHEMQAKVNTEKYLLSYTSYLHSICLDFYNEHDINKNDPHRRILPIALLNMSADKISAFTLFDKESSEYVGKRISLHATVFPNYVRFSNMRHVLPLLTHEISHEFRYICRKKRNEIIIDYLLKEFSKRIVRELLKESQIKTLTLNGVQIFVSDVLSDALKEVLFSNDYHMFEKLHMHEIPSKLYELISKKLLSFSDRMNGKVVYNTNKESVFSLNSKIVCEHIEELYNWLYKRGLIILERYEKTAISGMEHNTNIKYECYESIIKKLKSKNGKIDRKSFHEFFAYLFNDIDATLKNLYGDLYTRFYNYLNSIIGFDYGRLLFENAQLILTEVQKFYELNYQLKSEEENEILIKFCEDVVDVTVCLGIIGESSPIVLLSTETADNNLKEIFYTLQKTVAECSNSHSPYHVFIRSAKYRNVFNTMGLYNESEEIFINLLKKVLYFVNKDIELSFKDNINCYSEICADLGMCAAFRFTPFGYFRFLTHIFAQEKSEEWGKGKSFTIDRVNTVILTLLVHECLQDNCVESETDLRDKFNYLKGKLCCEIAEYIDQEFPLEEKKIAQDFYKNIKDSRDVMEKYIDKFNISNIQFSNVGLQKHYNDLYNNIYDSKWVKKCQKEDTVNIISEYYNSTTNLTDMEKNYLLFFSNHIDFVYRYYCKHRNFYNVLINKIKESSTVLTLEECMDILFDGRQQN